MSDLFSLEHLVSAVSVTASLLLAPLQVSAQQVTQSQPNIILFLIDDLGWRDLGCTGSDYYETPNLDRLASEGMLFTRAYAACPVCSPTRAAILTGKYPARVGMTQWLVGNLNAKVMDVPYIHHLPLTEISLAQALRDGGYQTWHVGKWHLGEERYYPQNHGFDVNIAGSKLGHPSGPNGYWGPYNLPNFTGEKGEYLTDRLTDEAINLMRNRNKTKPFFMNFWHYAVHTPIQAPADLVEKYKQKAHRLGLDTKQAIEVGEVLPFEWPDSPNPGHVRRRIIQSDPTYAAMMENLDTNIGRTLEALKEQGIADNTIIIFTSDNGGLATAEGSPTCNLPLSEGKGWCYEGGNRVALIVKWPDRIKPGSTVATPVTSTDFYPTLLEAAGLPLSPQQHVDGVSLMPLLTETGKLEREAIFWHYPHYANQGGTPAAAVVSGNWKLIEFLDDNHTVLFDLETDVGEKHDVSKDHPAITKRLTDALKRWQTDVGAKFPQPNPDWPK